MAKLFYSTEEAAQRLGVSEDELKNLVSSGELQEFRSGEDLVFKRDQVDLLAGGGDDASASASGMIPLAESGELDAISLAESGTGMNLETPKEQTGVSIFEADDLEQADPSAVTQMSDQPDELGGLEPVGSGSGLLDLTREADDTSLGADLLGDIYSDSGEAEEAATIGGETAIDAASGLFENTDAASDMDAGVGGAVAVVAEEELDGPGSGLAGGLALGMVLTLGFALALVIMARIGGSQNPLMEMVSSQYWMFVGIFAGVTVVPALIGMVMLRRS